MAYTNKILLLLTVTICVVSAINAQTQNSTDPPTDPTPAPSEDGSLNKALAPFYKLADGFLHAVFPKGLRPDIIRDVTDKIQNSPEISKEIWPLTKTLLNGYYGFATCFVIGILLAVLMPFIGCFCCCCRSCNNCGGKTHEQDPRNAKCKKVVCAGLLLVFTIITVGGMVLVFFSAAELHNLVKDGVVIDELQGSISNINKTAYKAIDEQIVQQADTILNDIEKNVGEFVDGAGTTLTSNFLNVTQIEGPVSNLAGELDTFNKTLDDLVASLQALQLNIDATHTNYSDAQTLANQTTCTGCKQLTSQIGSLVQDIESLSVQANSTQTIDSITDGPKRSLNSIPNLRVAYQEVNTTIFDKVEAQLNASKGDIKDKVQEATKDIKAKVQEATKGLRESVNTQASNILDAVNGFAVEADRVISGAGGDNAVELGSNYSWYATIAFGAMIAFVLLLYLCGMMCGCGERPGPDANCCNKGCGANFLLAAVGFTFIFYVILMLVTTLSFTVGSLLSSQVCWTIQEPSTSVELLRDNDFTISGNLTVYKILKSYSDCLDGGSIDGIISSLAPDFDKEALLKLVEQNAGQDKVDAIINGVTIPTANFNLTTPELTQSLTDLSSYNGLDTVQVPNVTAQVSDIQRNLATLILAVNAAKITADADGNTKLNRVIEYFEASKDVGIIEMAEATDEVLEHVERLKGNLPNLQNASSTLLDAVNAAQTDIASTGEAKMREALADLGTQLVNVITSDAKDGIDKILGGKCDGLADSVKQTADVMCDTVLHPFNGLWFSMGWCLIMFIPCMIIALVVSSLYRRELPYDGDYKEDLSRGYDRENIPLESRNRPVYHNYGDVSNQAFRDDYGYAMSQRGVGGPPGYGKF